MTWIRTIPPEAAEGELAELYAAIHKARGAIAEVHVAQSLHVRAMRAHLELYKAVVLSRSHLPRHVREAIAVIVSVTNGCEYCARHHGAALRALGTPAERVDALASGVVPSSWPEPERQLLAWARKAAAHPAEATAADLEGLRAQSLTDEAILDAVLVVSYFSFVNRLVLLLGVALEDGYEASCA